jgi:hypothetical protein
MMMREKIATVALPIVTTMMLAACGSDSGSPSDLLTGYFIDAPVEGLDYHTESNVSGMTDKHGKFQYHYGEKVSFSIGKLLVGKVEPLGDGLVTPGTIAVESQVSDKESFELQLLRVLQSLDSDGNPNNGITISKEIKNSLESIPKTQVSLSDYDDAELLKLSHGFAEALDEDFDGKIDVDEDQAKQHFNESKVKWDGGRKPGEALNEEASKEHNDEDAHKLPGAPNMGMHPEGHGKESEEKKELSDYPKVELANEQKYALAYMWNEEKLAKDLYTALNKKHSIKQFENIAERSETKHVEMVEELVERYGINITNLHDYTVKYSENELRGLPEGTFGIDKIQTLYNDLYAKGELSKADALQVGCMVEVTDVDDLNDYIEVARKVDALDLISVFERLRAGSYNHYWAFDKALKAENIENGCASAGEKFKKTSEEYPVSH